MPSLLIFAAYGFAVFGFYRFTQQKSVLVWALGLTAIIIFSPTISWPYIYDDIDHLYAVTSVHNLTDFVRFLFLPHNGHVMMLSNAVYFLSFKIFWLNPAAFHWVIIFILLAVAYIFFILIFEFTKSWPAVALGGVLICWSTSYVFSSMQIVFAQFLFCLFLIFLALSGMYFYAKTNRKKWMRLSGLAAFGAPLVSASGILTGLWAVLFLWLCIPGEYKAGIKKKWQIFFPVILGWLVGSGILIFLVKFYENGVFAFNPSYLLNAVGLSFTSLWLYSIPLVLPWEKASLFIGIFLIGMAIVKYRRMPWNIILFFFLWSIGNYLLIYYARGEYYEELISTERYHFLSSVSFPVIYALITASVFKDPELKNFRLNKILTFSIILFVAFLAHTQYNTVLRLSQNMPGLQPLGLEFNKAVGNYLEQAGVKKLQLKDREVGFGDIRFPNRPLKQYVSIFLFPGHYQEIAWGSEMDKGLVALITLSSRRYPLLKRFLEMNGY